MGAAYSTFTAVKKYGRIPTDLISTQCVSPPNKKMETQRRFYSTKRKRVNRKTVRYARPTMDEKELYFNILTSASLAKDPSKSVTLSLGKSLGISI